MFGMYEEHIGNFSGEIFRKAAVGRVNKIGK